MIGRIWGRFVYRVRDYCVYQYDAQAQGRGKADPAIESFDAANLPPAEVSALFRKYAGRINGGVMLGRLQRDLAVLQVIRENDDLIAYGWLQRWAPMRREFWWLADDAICIGPDWTHPSARGRGIFGRILRHSIAACLSRFPGLNYYIWAQSNNAASNRAIQKAQFAPLGTHRVVTVLGGLRHAHEKLESG